MEALRIVTRCTSREQFISMFRRFCSPTSCFIPSSDMRPVGTETAFSIRLADGTQLLRGEGVVLEAWSTAKNPYKRPGVHLGIHRLFDDSCETYEQLNVDRSVAVRMPVAAQLRLIHETVPSVASQLETPTIEMPPLPLPEEPRVPGSDIVLPANPLTEMTDDLVAAFVECNLTSDGTVVTPSNTPVSAPMTFESATVETPMTPADARPARAASLSDYVDAIPPADSPVMITDGTPVSTPFDATIKNPVVPEIAPVVIHPRAARDTVPNPRPAHSRDIIATLLGVVPLAKPQVYAAPTPITTELVDRVITPVEVPIVEPAPPSRRSVRAVAARLRRWWIPATVAATLVTVALWFTLTSV